MSTLTAFCQLIIALELYLVAFAPPLVLWWAIHVARSLRRSTIASERAIAFLYGPDSDIAGHVETGSNPSKPSIVPSAFGRHDFGTGCK
jgi:hypothetical protein